MMSVMDKRYVEGIYAGWLAKIIGIRLGAPVEGWTCEQIRNVYGKPEGYLVDYRDFAADDDSNGPIFLLRALEDSRKWERMEAEDVAEALLNYAPYEHGFFWWGGYGVSTEHTAYLNLWHGIPAPQSGCIEQNGHTVAEQIGGQIFIDTWGLVTPGNPDLAALLAKKAASVTHGGNGIYGGIFIAACISYAFVEKNICNIIEKGLSYLPEDCEYTKVVRAVMRYYEEHPESWEECCRYVYDNYGYDKYAGVCHIIPNSAVITLALLYGNGDFSDTLNICNLCGWDTDCNVGNVAVIMGVRNGLSGIDYEKWRKPINDFLACSSVVGSLNIMDIPYGAVYIAKLAAKLRGQELPEPFQEIAEKRIDSCHFEYPGSTHAIRIRREKGKIEECRIENTDESAASGSRSLKVSAGAVWPGEKIFIYKKTYYRPKDFHDSRYDPAFSPVIYPGQILHGSVMIPTYGLDISVSLYVKEQHTGIIYQGEWISPHKGIWNTLIYQIPEIEGAVIDEMGFCFCGSGGYAVTAFIDDLYATGTPAYAIDFSRESEEIWNPLHKEISQFTKFRGLLYLEKGQLNISCSDFGEAYTGRYDWKDYGAEFLITPVKGETHMVQIRVQGAMRSYAAGFLGNGKIGLLKKKKEYKELVSCNYCWKLGKEYRILLWVQKNRISVSVNGIEVLTYEDLEEPYMEGSVGIAVKNGSHCLCRKILILRSENKLDF